MRKFLPILVLFLIIVPQVFAAPSLDLVNQKVCDRFEEDIARMAGIMDEIRNRKGIKETRVAYGGIDDAIKSADYQITFVAEAIAYERAQKYSSVSQIKSSLEVLKGKVLDAKSAIGRVIE